MGWERKRKWLSTDARMSWAVKRFLLRQGNSCGICGKVIESMDEATIDHIVPISKGGMHSPKNMQLAHASCNSAKGNTKDELR